MKSILTRPRIQAPRLRELLAQFPVVVVHGARQTGKSTLVRMPGIGDGRQYRTLDDLDVLDLARRSPDVLLAGDAPLTFDEVQRAPDLLLAVKRAVDRDRQPGRFLLTGSANLLLMKRVSESLAGRAVYLPMLPMTWGEVDGRATQDGWRFLSARSAKEALAAAADTPSPGRSLEEALLAGGYPVPALMGDPAARVAWFDGYVQTYLERDLRELTATDRLIEFRRFLRIAAAQSGALLNLSSLARDSGISPATAGRYLAVLEASFQVRLLPAYSVNRSRRLIKAPRLYATDTAFALHLAGVAGLPRPGTREHGALLEMLVLNHLEAWRSIHQPGAVLSTWRTASNLEVDLVLEAPDRLLPIEVKWTQRPAGDDLKGLNAFLEEHPEAPFGTLLCRVPEPRRLSERVVALPVERVLAG